MSKHDEVLKYIHSLVEGTKISVRQVSSHLGVSEGTSYRAIKFAEKEGSVKTVPRVGTIRTIKKEVKSDPHLTFKQVAAAVDGIFLAGGNTRSEEITKIAIGAMQAESIDDYLEKGALLIVGNRESAQRKALEHDTGLLVTGGFKVGQSFIQIAEKKGLPIISTKSDTFTVASIIHRELYSHEVSSNLITANQLAIKSVDYLYDLKSKVNRNFVPSDKITILMSGDRYLGGAYSNHLDDINRSNYKNYLIPNIEVYADSTIQYMRQVMSWGQFNILPVINNNNEFIGIVHRRDVFKSIEPIKLKSGLTHDEVINREIVYGESEILISVLPIMTNTYGSLTHAALITIFERLIDLKLRQLNVTTWHIDTMNMTNFKVTQIYQSLHVHGEILDVGEQYIRLEATLMVDEILHTKAHFMIQYYKEKN